MQVKPYFITALAVKRFDILKKQHVLRFCRYFKNNWKDAEESIDSLIIHKKIFGSTYFYLKNVSKVSKYLANVLFF